MARLTFQLDTGISAGAAARADIGSPVASGEITRIIAGLTPFRDAIASASLYAQTSIMPGAMPAIEKTAQGALDDLSALARSSVIDASRRADLSRVAVEKARLSFVAVTGSVALALGLFAFLMVRGTVNADPFDRGRHAAGRTGRPGAGHHPLAPGATSRARFCTLATRVPAQRGAHCVPCAP